MKKYKKRIIFAISAVFIAFLCLYFSILFLLPPLLNSKTFMQKTAAIILKNTGCKVETENFNIKITPLFSINLKADKLSVSKNGTEFLNAKDLEARTKFTSIKKANAKYLFLNLNKFPEKGGKQRFKTAFLPDIYIENAEIIFDEKGDFKGEFSNFSIKEIGDKKYIKFYGKLSSPFLKENLVLGEKGFIFAQKNALIAKDFEISSGNSSIILNGKIFDENKNRNFYINAKNIKTADFMASLLYFQKSKDPSKKFIENFYDYKGNIDIDLNFRNEGIFGSCIAKDLGAHTVLFNAPVYFREAVFIFNKTEVNSTAKGTLADEEVVHSLHIEDVTSPKRLVLGKIESKLQNKIDRYIPGLKTVGEQNISVEYGIKNKIITVDYLLTLKKGANIFYKDASLDLKDKERRLFVHTLKNNKILYIKNYDYSVLKKGEIFNIVVGRGLFIKRGGKMKAKYLSAKTNGFAPASVAGSFGRFISGGVFSGNLKYDFLKNKIYGNFIIKNARHKDFYVQKAEVNADKKYINILAEGRYRGEKFTSRMCARNKVANKIIIYNMNLFLDKYTARKGKGALSLKPHKHHKRGYRAKIRDIDLTIENWKIRVNKIVKDRIILNNVSLKGSLKKDIFRFSTSDINFAKGVLNAKGLYDFNKKSSSVRFTAKKVDSNTAADLIFNLKGQVEGTADGILYIKTFNRLNDIKAKVVFSINQGYLPKVGDIEFKNKFTRKKIKISKIIRVKNEENKPVNPQEFASDIKGSFYADNYSLKDISITSKQKHLALLFEGEYDIESENADLMIFGKYNNSKQRRVKILFMPLSFVMKMLFRPENSLENYREKFEKVPDVGAKEGTPGLFRIKIKGSPKEDNMDVEMKRIY